MQVLVVEDDEGLNKLVQKSLRKEGFNCRGVLTGADAIDIVKNNTNLVLLIDQRLPDMDGTELVRTLIDRGYKIPFIAMTGNGDEKIAVEMMKLGARDYLIKGLDLTNILPMIFKHLYNELHTEQKLAHAEETLRQNQGRYKALLETTKVIAYEIDLETLEFKYISPQVFDITGYPVKVWKDFEFWSNTIHPDERDYCVNFCMKKTKKGSDHEFEYRMVTADEKIIWFKNLVSLGKKEGKPFSLRGFLIDITQQKKMGLQLQQSQKMESIGTLAGGIAHDFNNMLGIITGNISFALSILNKDDELYEVLSDVQESSKQAKNLTHQLLTFSIGGSPITKSSDINRLLKESAIFVTRGAKANCNFELSDDLWLSEIDEGQVNQVIGNLIINANQAMPNGGIITIRTENTEIKIKSDLPLSAGRYIKIEVEDQGVGISEKHLTNIFDPYFTTKQKGSGLGLATTYSIIARHGGYISAYSEIEKGTIFSIYLPASSMALKETVDKEETKHEGEGKILIMDDQEPILKMVGRIINRMGYDTVSATDGSKAVELYRDAYQSGNPFGLVILDLTVPGGMGGLKTIIELLKIDPKVKAVVSSGYSNDPIMANYEDYGFCGVVPKPYTKAQLSEVLNKIFSEKG